MKKKLFVSFTLILVIILSIFVFNVDKNKAFTDNRKVEKTNDNILIDSSDLFKDVSLNKSSGVNINNIDEQWDKQYFSGFVFEHSYYKGISLDDILSVEKNTLKQNEIHYEPNIFKNDVNSKIENQVLKDSNNYGKLYKTFRYNDGVSLEVYKKELLFENDKIVDCLSYVFNKDNAKNLIWNDWSIRYDKPQIYDIIDIIVSKNMERMVVLYQGEWGGFNLNTIDLNSKTEYSISLSPYNSFNTGARRFSSIRIWNYNVVRYDVEYGVEYYKIYQTKEDMFNNFEKLKREEPDYLKHSINFECPKLVYASKEKNNRIKSYDYGNYDIDFNLDGYYYESVDKIKENIIL